MEDKKMLNDEELKNVNGGVDKVLADCQEKSIPDRGEEVNWGTKVPEKLPGGIEPLFNTHDHPMQIPNSDKNNNGEDCVVISGEMHSWY